jgi:hypothetical protein
MGWRILVNFKILISVKNRKNPDRLHNLSVACQLDLFDTIAKPILVYGCEVWGVGNKDIDVANVNINYRLPIKGYYRICTLLDISESK